MGHDGSPVQFPGLHDGARKFISPHLRVKIVVYPLGSKVPDVYIPRTSEAEKVIGPQQQELEHATMINFSWNKAMGQASGVWQAVLKEAEEGSLEDFVIDGDWVDISVIRNGYDIPICRGIVDSFRENRRSPAGAPVVTFTMKGRDHGAFFEYPITWNNIWVQTLGELVNGLFTERVKGKIGGSPDEMFKILIAGTFAKGTVAGQWEIPDALQDKAQGKDAFIDLLRVTVDKDKGLLGASDGAISASAPSSLRGAYYNEPALWTTGGQTLHQTLQQWCNPLLNEMWYDLLPPPDFYPADSPIAAAFTSSSKKFGEMAAIIRERPFLNTTDKSDSPWFNLPTWTLPLWLVQETDLGRSGAQRYNLFELLADVGMGAGVEQAPQAKPVWNKADIRARGLRTYTQSTRYLATIQSGKKTGVGQWFEERGTWQDLLADWHSVAPYLRQGTIVVKTMLPEVRIGQRIKLDSGNPKTAETFYVESIALQWENYDPSGSTPPRGSSTIVVSRGFKGTDEDKLKKLIDHIGFFRQTF